MWLICFQPIGTDRFVPQILCNSEQEAKEWVKNAPFSVVGSYVYMFVPLNRPTGYFQRQEPYQCPGYDYNQYYPYWFTTPERRPWQIEIGDWPDSTPKITC